LIRIMKDPMVQTMEETREEIMVMTLEDLKSTETRAFVIMIRTSMREDNLDNGAILLIPRMKENTGLAHTVGATSAIKDMMTITNHLTGISSINKAWAIVNMVQIMDEVKDIPDSKEEVMEEAVTIRNGGADRLD